MEVGGERVMPVADPLDGRPIRLAAQATRANSEQVLLRMAKLPPTSPDMPRMATGATRARGDVVALPHHTVAGAGNGAPPRDVYSVQSVRSFSESEKAYGFPAKTSTFRTTQIRPLLPTSFTS